MTEMPQNEPVRWLADPSVDAALRADLAHGANAVAGGVDYAATLGALQAAIAATGATATATATSSVGTVGAASSAGAIKLGIAAVVVAGAAAWWLGTRTDPQPREVAPVVVQDRAPVGPATADAPPSTNARPEPARGVVAPDVTPKSTPTDPPQEQETPAVDPPREDARPDSPEPKTKRPAEPDSDADRFLKEANLVATARKQLADDPSAALASTRRLARDFPRGALVEESRAIEVRALAQLGRADEAKRKATEFLGRFPDGPHAAAVKRAVAGL